jgi:hypothetical protein
MHGPASTDFYGSNTSEAFQRNVVKEGEVIGTCGMEYKVPSFLFVHSRKFILPLFF